MTNPHLAAAAPSTVNGTVTRQPPRRRRNAEVRAREYLTDTEVARLIVAAGNNRHAHRDATAVLVAYRHGLRASELVGLQWDCVDFAHGRLHVNRAKSGSPSVHPLSGRELRALRRLRREQEPVSPFIFTSERSAPFTAAGFRKLIARLGVAAGFGFPVHPHMCGTPVVSRLRTKASIPAACKPTWGTGTSSIPSDTPSSLLPDSKVSGTIRRASDFGTISSMASAIRY